MFTTWLDRLPEDVRREVNADLRYMQQFGRDAALPVVRHRIQTSAEYPDMAETRTHITTSGRQWVIRCLVVHADQDRALACCIGGDKAQWENTHPDGPDWYDAFVPVADQIFQRLHLTEGWKR